MRDIAWACMRHRVRLHVIEPIRGPLETTRNAPAPRGIRALESRHAAWSADYTPSTPGPTTSPNARVPRGRGTNNISMPFQQSS